MTPETESAAGYTVVCDTCGPVMTRLNRASNSEFLTDAMELAGGHYEQCGAETWIETADGS